jgi:hypothetical protein
MNKISKIDSSKVEEIAIKRIFANNDWREINGHFHNSYLGVIVAFHRTPMRLNIFTHDGLSVASVKSVSAFVDFFLKNTGVEVDRKGDPITFSV